MAQRWGAWEINTWLSFLPTLKFVSMPPLSTLNQNLGGNGTEIRLFIMMCHRRHSIEGELWGMNLKRQMKMFSINSQYLTLCLELSRYLWMCGRMDGRGGWLEEGIDEWMKKKLEFIGSYLKAFVIFCQLSFWALLSGGFRIVWVLVYGRAWPSIIKTSEIRYLLTVIYCKAVQSVSCFWMRLWVRKHWLQPGQQHLGWMQWQLYLHQLQYPRPALAVCHWSHVPLVSANCRGFLSVSYWFCLFLHALPIHFLSAWVSQNMFPLFAWKNTEKNFWYLSKGPNNTGSKFTFHF